jgi:bifunctional non-homologous end joining protein LigD
MAKQQEVAGVPITRPDKIMYPGAGISKADIANYYADVAQQMVPHMTDRPISMQRWPNGVGGFNFFEKKVPEHFPSWISTTRVDTANGRQDQVVVCDRASLVYLADQACLTPHIWLSTTATLNCPDQMIFDLDPSADDLSAIRRATRLVGRTLDELGLTSFIKTSGSRGYHVVVPLRPTTPFDTVRQFAEKLAAMLAADHPDLVTAEQRKDQRGDRVFVDVLRNSYAQTVVPPYALRGRAGAPVATPIDWDELSRVEPDHYDLNSVRNRLSQRACPWRDIQRHAQNLGSAASALHLSAA